jgi:hypothetical protein
MDDNTASVLTNLIQIAGISCIFWAAAFVIRWQAGYVIPSNSPDDDDDDDDDWDDMEEGEAETCPSFGICPYREDFKLRYGLNDLTLRDLTAWFVKVAVGAGVVGFWLGMLLV